MTQSRVRAGDQIASWSVPDSEPSGRVAIHLAGLPNSPNPIPGITEFLLELGFSVLQPHYTGTYDSGGIFDPYNAHDCVGFWIDRLHSGEVVDVMTDQALEVRSVELLSCHSFGTFVGMAALRRGLRCARAVFFATSFSYGAAGYRFGQIGDRSEDAKWVTNGFPRTFAASDAGLIEEFYTVNSQADLNVDEVDFVTECFVVVPGADDGLDPIRSKQGASEFIGSHPERFSLVGSQIAQGAGHAVASMLTPDVRMALGGWLNP